MKKPLFIFLFAILLSNQTSIAQGIQVGIKGALSSTWLLNNHVSNAEARVQIYIPSFGQNYGLSGALFFSKKMGVEVNFLYVTHRQKYSNDGEDFESETKLTQINIPLLLKFRSETGAFFEIGIAYNALNSAEFSLKIDSISIPKQDLKPIMAKSSFDALLGVGVDIHLVAGLSLTTSIRFAYSMTDLRGVDAFGGDLSNSNWLNALYDGKYEQTRAASAGFIIGLTYSIGKIAGD